jgi:hypothetical protein
MCDVVGMPKLMGYAFALFPMWPKLKAAANALPYDLTIMADTEILGARAQQVRIPVLVGGGAKSPEALKVAVRKVASAIPTSTTKWLEGQTHNLGAVPAAAMAMMKEFFV